MDRERKEKDKGMMRRDKKMKAGQKRRNYIKQKMTQQKMTQQKMSR